MAAPYFVAAHGKPFTDRDAAEFKARTLTAELSEPFEAVPHPDGGYVVQPAGPLPIRSPPDPENPWRLTQATPANPLPREETGAGNKPQPAFATLTLRPAWRGFWHLFLAAGMGLWFALVPDAVLDALAVLPDVLQGQALQAATGLVRFFGLGVFSTALACVSFRRLSAHYLATADALQSRYGIVSRTVVTAMYAHVFSVDVRQGVIDRLLDVGTVEVSTAATNDSDVSFRGVARPMALAQEISRRIAYYNEHRRPQPG